MAAIEREVFEAIVGSALLILLWLPLLRISIISSIFSANTRFFFGLHSYAYLESIPCVFSTYTSHTPQCTDFIH